MTAQTANTTRTRAHWSPDVNDDGEYGLDVVIRIEQRDGRGLRAIHSSSQTFYVVHPVGGDVDLDGHWNGGDLDLTMAQLGWRRTTPWSESAHGSLADVEAV